MLMTPELFCSGRMLALEGGAMTRYLNWIHLKRCLVSFRHLDGFHSSASCRYRSSCSFIIQVSVSS
ncbi:uncharacterized protein PgNI_01546, partial [Pyricularia grisea]|uniref:Uncharacterized protein n=1 Tax=Pyricularia grisea TaxID=148305 RepID=A0A6P8BKT5_PYRGI